MVDSKIISLIKLTNPNHLLNYMKKKLYNYNYWLTINFIVVHKLAGGKPVGWLFTRVSEEMNSRTNPLSGQRRERRLNSAPPDHSSSALTATRPLCFDGKRELKNNSYMPWSLKDEGRTKQQRLSVLSFRVARERWHEIVLIARRANHTRFFISFCDTWLMMSIIFAWDDNTI